MKKLKCNLERRFGQTVGTFLFVVIHCISNVWLPILGLIIAKHSSFVLAAAIIFIFYWSQSTIVGLFEKRLNNYKQNDVVGELLIDENGEKILVCMDVDRIDFENIIENKYCILTVNHCENLDVPDKDIDETHHDE